MAINVHSSGPDEWLTPPELIAAAGRFDLDPCASLNQPWRTAKTMYTVSDNGLEKDWKGRVWLNPPYSNVRPFVDKFLAHGNGLALLSAKSVDSRWSQSILRGSDAVLFLKGRLLFCYPDGARSNGKWLSNMLCALGARNVKALIELSKSNWPGIIMKRMD